MRTKSGVGVTARPGALWCLKAFGPSGSHANSSWSTRAWGPVWPSPTPYGGTAPDPPKLAYAAGDDGSSLLYEAFVDGTTVKGHLHAEELWGRVYRGHPALPKHRQQRLPLTASVLLRTLFYWRAYRGLSQLILP